MSDLARTVKDKAATALGSAPPKVLDVVGRTGAWLERTARPDAGHDADHDPAPVVVADPPPVVVGPEPVSFPTERPLPLPDGMTEADLRAVYATWSIDGEPAGHMDAYVADSFWRFVHTYGLAKDLTGTALELGANPYFTTYLLDKHSALDLRLANYFDGSTPQLSQPLSYVGADGEPVTKVHESVQFNVEGDVFPFDDESLDVVIFCEIIEHLLMNPVATLREIARVLKPGGHIIVTTPNVARLANLVYLIEGRSIYDPYSGFGPYGRHNREYSLHELVQLLAFVGFDAAETFTADGHPNPPLDAGRLAAIAPLIEHRRNDLGQYLFVRATKVRPSREGLPDNLFRSWPEGEIVPA